jgi:hypothetical protein
MPELAVHAYDAAAWRFRRPRRDLNFQDVESLEETEFLAPALCVINEEDQLGPDATGESRPLCQQR